MKIHSRAPIRIDLAGGTLDLWPIFLMLKDAQTINLGINLFAEAELEEIEIDQPDFLYSFELSSADQTSRLEFSIAELEQVAPPASLDLHVRILRHFILGDPSFKLPRGKRLKLNTKAQSPAGAGLGGSSALTIALVSAVFNWVRKSKGQPIASAKENGTQWIETARDIESQVLRVPAGLQDYYGAVYGGLQCIHWRIQSHHRESLDIDGSLKELSDRLLLFYSGKSRNSGLNNWNLYKSFVDGDEKVIESFQRIASATRSLRTALLKKDWPKVGDAIQADWTTRRGLASGISTIEIDQALSEASKSGSVASKICGAGGGGCFFVYLPSVDTSLKNTIVQKLAAMDGIRHLPFETSNQGVQVEVHVDPV